jgi:hypothetical protein
MNKNIVIPKRSVWSVLGLLLLGSFTYLQAIGYVIPGLRMIFNLKKETIQITDIGLIGVPIITYILIATMICLTVNIFKKLKSYRENGLIGGLIVGLIGGLIWSLIIGLIGCLIGCVIVGLIGGPISVPIVCLIMGLIWGLISVLIVCLIGGPIVGLANELKP